jgi:hypothetical protein
MLRPTITTPTGRTDGARKQRWLPSPSFALACTALFLVLGGSAFAARGLIGARDIAPGAVTSRAIRDGAVETKALSARTRALLRGTPGAPGNKGGNGSTGTVGATGANGINGLTGTVGTSGANGPNGANGAEGAKGSNGANGANGPNGVDGTNGIDGLKGANGTDGTNGAEGAKGSNGANGANGANGPNGVDGTNGIDGLKGANGTNGVNGTITPLSAKQGLTPLPTGSPPTIVVELSVPAGNYVVLAKTQLSQTGAGDSVECTLRSGASTVDQAAIKTLPALAAVPASMQAVITTSASSTLLTVQCAVAVANGAANLSSLIVIPTT